MAKISQLPGVLSVVSTDEIVVNTNVAGTLTTATITLANLFNSMGIIITPTGFPGAIPNCIFWLRANQFDTSTNGTPVTSWTDLSGNSNNFSAIGSSGNQPLVALNSINTTYTSVSNSGLRGLQGSTLTIGPSNWTIFAVIKFTSATTYFFSPGSSSSSQSRFGLDGSQHFQWTISGVADYFTNQTVPLNQWLYFVMTNNGGVKTVYINGTALTWQSTPSTSSGNATGICIMDGYAGTSPFQGEVAEISAYTISVTNAQQVNDLQNYAAARYNIL